MRALTKLAILVLVVGLCAAFLVESAFQAGESLNETVSRHEAIAEGL